MEQRKYPKLSHRAVDYVGVSHHPGRRCALCKHFIDSDPPACEGVQSPIDRRGWCDQFAFENEARKSGMRG